MPAVISTTAKSAASHENTDDASSHGDCMPVPGADALVAPAEYTPLAWTPALEAFKPQEPEREETSLYEILSGHDFDEG